MLFAGLAGLLVIAAIGDLRSYTIPNWLNISVVVLFIPYATYAPLGHRDLALHLAAAAAVFAVSTLLFARGLFGGGDVKLLSSLALWVGLINLPRLLLTMAIAGGLLAMIMLIVRWCNRSEDRRLPYGIAIALAGLDYCLGAVHLTLW